VEHQPELYTWHIIARGMEKLRAEMNSSQELNWEEASQREFMSGESSINNAGLYPSGTCGISKDASNVVCSQAEEEEK